MDRRPRPLVERIMDKVLVGDGCWLWQATTGTNGYGLIRVGAHRRCAHRVMYELLVGPIPEGLTLDHLCRVRSCVRPSHLEPVTQAENNRRAAIDTTRWTTAGIAAAAVARRARTHCVHGHEFTPENTRIRDGRHRICRACSRASSQAHRSKRRAA